MTNKAMTDLDDNDFMAQLLGVSANQVENRSINFSEQLRSVVTSTDRKPSIEHIRSGSEPGSRR